MGKLARKIRRGRPIPVRELLTEEQYNMVVAEVKETLLQDTIYDVMSVVVDILNTKWGAMNPRSARMRVFGKEFLERFAVQCKTKSDANHELLVEAGIVQRKE